MAKCAYKKRDGSPCQGSAIEGLSGGCWNHAPELELARRRNARAGGKRGGRGRTHAGSADLLRLQHQFEDLAAKVLAGTVDSRNGAVAAQCLNGARSCVLGVARIKEAVEFEERLSQLERQRGLS